MNIELQLYTDEKTIASSLIRAFWKEHNNYVQSSEETTSNLKEWTKSGHQLYFIKQDSNFVGFIYLGNRGIEIDWLEDIFVLPEYQGKGIGTQAIRLIEDIVKEYSGSLYIEAAAQNEKAIRLYQRIGYNHLNTITIRKDFCPNKFETIRNENIYDLKFNIMKIKE